MTSTITQLFGEIGYGIKMCTGVPIVDYACGHMMYMKQKKEGDQHVDCLL